MKSRFFLIVSLFITGVVSSQTLEERNKIVKYYNEINDNSVQFDYNRYPLNEKELAVKKAVSLGIPLTIVGADGNIGDLVRFNGNMPLYYTASNEGSVLTTKANLLQPGGAMGLNLKGKDLFVGVWDQTRPLTNHNGFRDANGNGPTRATSMDSSPLDLSNHATHVLGTIISSGFSAPGISGRGVAYEATGLIYDWNNDIAEMQDFASNGFLLSNHSYGLGASSLPVPFFGAYVSDSRAIDNICFSYPKYLPVYAAGNDRGSFSLYNPTKSGNDLLSGDKTSKNSIVVGAVSGVSNYLQPSDVEMSSFSSYGPTDDFRIKPDLVAKGVNVFSTTYSVSSFNSYGLLSGTSMASPGVTGSLLLVQEHFGDPYMMAATLKGLALHTAEEAGPSNGPDHMFGWGLLNVAKMVEVLQDKDSKSFVKELVLNSGDVYTFNVMALGNVPLKASISWTDRGGVANSGTGTADIVTPTLVNDLDLRITKSGTTYFPWKLKKDWANIIALQEDNNVDPFERVDISNPNGVYQITISGKAGLVGGSQNYSLVVTGVDANANLSTNSFVADANSLWFNSIDKVLNFDLSDDFLGGEISIFDGNGRLVHKNKVENTSGSVNVNSYQNGFYVVKVIANNGNAVIKKIIL
jgi:serine protease AprX